MFSFIFDGAEILEYAKIIDSVSFEDVKELFKKSFSAQFFTMSVVYPLDK